MSIAPLSHRRALVDVEIAGLALPLRGNPAPFDRQRRGCLQEVLRPVRALHHRVDRVDLVQDSRSCLSR
ncbi:hypothetical protein [Kitasatospora cineracea]|uniref:hypothetical protein n=1 Tax=Kitasatospora cineracea TaxID=88074 RepID=UPI0037875769